MNQNIKTPDNQEKTRRIRNGILMGEKLARKKIAVLKYQNFLGMFFFLTSIMTMIGATYAYAAGWMNLWIVIPLNAFAASILHELEHDLIHSQYFKGTFTETLMMWGVWIFRGNTPSPFYRKKIHLLHHKVSGQVTDIEEQMIGNGMRWGLTRIIVMFDQNLAFLINHRKLRKTAPAFREKEMVASAFPVTLLFHVLLDSYILLWLIPFVFAQTGNDIELPAFLLQIRHILTIIAVGYLIPNIIRQGSLQLISSNMHYFGDIAEGEEGVIQQTQVLRSWFLLPFQMFCFNFGGTHGIHHFVINQPFYLRQLISPVAYKVMRKYGVRFNDNGTFKRANRYFKPLTV